jgi:toxin FitB
VCQRRERQGQPQALVSSTLLATTPPGTQGRQSQSAGFVGEIERGIARQRAADPGFAGALALWLDRVLTLYGEQVVPFDLRAARRWGALSAALGNDSANLMIAATALEHGLTMVTRNVSDFEPTGVAVLDPFSRQRNRKS